MFWIEKSGNDWKVKNCCMDKDAANIKCLEITDFCIYGKE
jgi:hypothetical protein